MEFGCGATTIGVEGTIICVGELKVIRLLDPVTSPSLKLPTYCNVYPWGTATVGVDTTAITCPVGILVVSCCVIGDVNENC